jgi:hypothetical protein
MGEGDYEYLWMDCCNTDCTAQENAIVLWDYDGVHIAGYAESLSVMHTFSGTSVRTLFFTKRR